MGLLDAVGDDAGLLGLYLMAAGSAKPVRTGLGEGLLGGVQFLQQNRAAKEDRELKKRMSGLQEQQLMMALAAQKQQQEDAARARANEDAFRRLIPSPQMQSNMDALSAGGGPTNANAARVQPVDPLAQLTHKAMELGQIRPTDYLSSLRKDEAPLIVGEGAAVLKGGKPIFTNPKAEALPSSVREFNFASQNPAFMEFLREQANLKAPRTSVNVNTGERIPHQLVKQQDDLIDKITVAMSTDADLGAVAAKIGSGELKFGPMRNLYNTARNVAGVSNEESRAFGTFKSTLEKLRNDSLRLNTGVQTEGDAQRAWNELFQNINDTEFVGKRLDEIRKINQRAAQIHEYRLNVLRQNSGAGPLPQPQIKPAIAADDSGGFRVLGKE
jgi:hypothetical protein